MIRFSVVIPCRNERASLGACLDALEAQDHPREATEILVIDGDSTDGSRELAEGRGARVLSDPGTGPAAARNVGIDAASEDIIAFTDADCVPRFDWLSTLAERFATDRDAAGFAGALRLPRDTLLGRMEDNDARAWYEGYITSNVAYRRRALLEVGGFDETLCCAEDYDLAWRLLDAGHRIEREPRAVVLHDPPEIRASVAAYLRKQFWYARHDIPAHASAIRRAWLANGHAAGSRRAVAGVFDALERSTFTAGLTASLLGRSPKLFAASIFAATLSSAGRIAQTAAIVQDGSRETIQMASIETAKRLVRGAGTLVGIADLAMPGEREPRYGARAWRTAPPMRAVA